MCQPLILISAEGHKPYNQLLNEHSLADTSTSEEANLSTTGVGSQQIDDLNTGNENFSRGRLLGELWGIGVDGSHLGGLDRATLIDWVASDVDDATEGARADGNHDGRASVGSNGATDQTFGTYWSATSVSGLAKRRNMQLTVHGNTPHNVLAQMLLERCLATIVVLIVLMCATYCNL
jgi:hypothetical protein